MMIDPKLETAYIIGNGASRQMVNLNHLPNGRIYGCNALYREFIPDWLIAIDRGMIEEINRSDFPKDRLYIPPINEQFEPIQLYHDLNLVPADFTGPTPRSNAGMNAMQLALAHGAKQLVMIGFDFIVASENIGTSNVYAGTKNYDDDTKATYHDNVARMRYLNWFIDQCLGIRFVFVFPVIDGSATIWEFTCKNTVYGLSYEEFNKWLNELELTSDVIKN